MAAPTPRYKIRTTSMAEGDLSNTDSRTLADNVRSAPKRRLIEVHAVGEYTLPPDVYIFTVTLRSTKPSTEAAKQSVKRRLDYVNHVLHNIHKLPQVAVQMSRDVSKTEDSSTVRCQVHVNCSVPKVAEECRNHLMEKLDMSVKISPISCSYTVKAKESLRLVQVHCHSELYALCLYISPYASYIRINPYTYVPYALYICICPYICSVYMYISLCFLILSSLSTLPATRAKAFLQAVNSAQRKAESVSQSLGLLLHLPQSIVEHSCVLIPSDKEPHHCPEEEETRNPVDCQPLREKVQEATLSYSSSVTAIFEMAPKRTCYHKTCPKHFPQ